MRGGLEGVGLVVRWFGWLVERLVVECCLEVRTGGGWLWRLVVGEIEVVDCEWENVVERENR